MAAMAMYLEKPMGSVVAIDKKKGGVNGVNHFLKMARKGQLIFGRWDAHLTFGPDIKTVCLCGLIFHTR